MFIVAHEKENIFCLLQNTIILLYSHIAHWGSPLASSGLRYGDNDYMMIPTFFGWYATGNQSSLLSPITEFSVGTKFL